MTTLPKSLSSQLAFGITKSTSSQTPGRVLIAMVAGALLSGTQGEKLRGWGLFHFIVSQETIPQETAYIQRGRRQMNCVSCSSYFLPPYCCLQDAPPCFPLPFCAWGGGKGVFSVATTVLGWQKEVGGAQGVKTQCEPLLGSYPPGVPHWNILCPRVASLSEALLSQGLGGSDTFAPGELFLCIPSRPRGSPDVGLPQGSWCAWGCPAPGIGVQILVRQMCVT